MFPGSRRAEQLSLRSQQRMVATVEDSVLRTEMTGLESQEEDAPKCILFFWHLQVDELAGVDQVSP